MMATRIRYGLRRYSLAASLFGLIGAGMLAWSSRISQRTFVFPFGIVEPQAARLLIGGVGVVALTYLAAISYARFVRRPEIVLAERKIELPLGELGHRSLVIREGELVGFAEGKTGGGWRHMRIVYRDGAVTLSSAQLPDDDAFERVRAHLSTLVTASPVASPHEPKAD
jgi:hypothetical protein